MEQLILRLLERDGQEWQAEWLLLGGRGEPAVGGSAGPLSGIAGRIPAAQARGRRVCVIVPGEQVTLSAVAISGKQQRHRHKILPFLVEEQLAEDVGAMQIAAASVRDAQGQTLVAVVRKSVLESWLKALAAAGLEAQEMLPETCLMPPAKEGWSLVWGERTAWLFAGASRYFAVEHAMLPDLVRLLMAENAVPLQRMECVLCGTRDGIGAIPILAGLQAAYPQLVMQATARESAFAVFCDRYRELPQASFPNLLQGEFYPSGRRSETSGLWRMLGRMAALWLAGLLLVDGGQAAFLSYKAAAFRGEEAALYKELFPSETKIIEPRRQMENHLSGLSGQQSGFLSLFGQVALRWPADDAGPVSLQAIAYNESDGQLTFTIAGGSMELVNQLTQKLNTGGMNARMMSVVSTPEGVKGQLSIKGEGQ